MKDLKSITIKGCIVLIAFSTACSKNVSNELTEQQKNKITNEIELIIEDLANPDNSNAEYLTSLKANTGDYVFASDGKIKYTDYQSYKESVKLSFDKVHKFLDFKSTRTIIYPLALDAATCTVELEGEFISISGDTIKIGGCYTYVFKKLNNEWKVIQENGARSNE